MNLSLQIGPGAQSSVQVTHEADGRTVITFTPRSEICVGGTAIARFDDPASPSRIEIDADGSIRIDADRIVITSP